MEGDKNATDHTYYGKALIGLGKHEQAIEQFHKALTKSPEARAGYRAVPQGPHQES